MKKANLYILLAAFISANLFLVRNSYTQWTVSGNLSGLDGRPTVSVVDQNTAWVTGGSTVNVTYRTSNGGINWTLSNTNGINPFYCIWALDANTAFAGDNGYGGTSKLYRTYSGGMNWTVIDSVQNTTGFRSIKFSNTIPNFGIALGGWELSNYYLYKTRDFGVSWTKHLVPIYSGYSSAISGLNVIDSSFYAFGTTGGSPSIILTTNGGVTYNLQNINLDSVGGNFTRGVAFNNDKLIGIAGATSLPFISRTTNGGLNWVRINVGPFAMSNDSPVMRWIEGTNICYMTSPYSSGVLKSTNGGLDWNQMTTSGLGTFSMDIKRFGLNIYGYANSFPSGTASTVLKLTDIVTGSDKRFFANLITTTPKLFTKSSLSSNGTYTEFGPGEAIPYAGMEFDDLGNLYCIGTEFNPSLKVLDTTSGILSNLGPITGLTTPEQNNCRLAFNTLDNKMYMSVWAAGIVQSHLYTLNLNTREATFIGLGDYNTADIAINSAGQCYGIANINVLHSIDLSTGQHTRIGGLDYNSGGLQQGLCFDRETGVLYITAWYNDSLRAEMRTINLPTATTTFQYVFEPQLGSRICGFAMPFNNVVGILNTSLQVPDGYLLKQNYPNPFNPVTNLEFGILKLGFVSLKVFNVLGKEIASLVKSNLKPGTYKYNFDGSNLSSGVYFYKLEADGFVDTKKMLLVK